MSIKAHINKAVKLVGKQNLAKELGISYQAIYNWKLHNRMPDSEYSCRTHHAVKIEAITNGQVTVQDLLGHIPTCVAMARQQDDVYASAKN